MNRFDTRDATGAAVREARDRGEGRRRAAVVLEVDALGTTALVMPDGPDDGSAVMGPHGAEVVCPTALSPGDRVLVEYVPPHGCQVVGRRGGDVDPWHRVGDPGEPDWNGVWQHHSTAGDPGTGAPGYVRFRSVGILTVLAGLAERPSGSVMTMFRLPPQYAPENDIVVQASNILTGATGLVIRQDGDLESPSAGELYLDGIAFPRAFWGGT